MFTMDVFSPCGVFVVDGESDGDGVLCVGGDGACSYGIVMGCVVSLSYGVM